MQSMFRRGQQSQDDHFWPLCFIGAMGWLLAGAFIVAKLVNAGE